MSEGGYRRRSARVLVVNAAGEVLLLESWREPEQRRRGTIWLTPGGGVGAGESLAVAAARELREEVGLVVDPAVLGEPVAYTEGWADLGFAAGVFRDDLFLLRVDAHQVDDSGMEELESGFVVGHRWWSLPELAASTSTIYPYGLVPLLTDLLAGRRGDRPVELPWHELRVRLGHWPTPLQRAPRLGAALGLADLWVKRDDLTGLGAGGNKVRKLEYALREALAAGATTVITTGAAQSNHARLTAAAAASRGLACTLVLTGPPAEPPQGNLVLDALAGASVVWADRSTVDEAMAGAAAAVREAGGVPYVLPLGGSTPYSVRGYVDCAAELLADLPDLDHVVVAIGSGGTMAGLVAGLGADRVLGVDTGALPDPAAAVHALLTDLGHLGGAGPAAAVPPPAGALRIDLDQVGTGYEALTDPVVAALRLAARTEGLFLDPTYTGRALAGLAAHARAGLVAPTDRIVLLHTGGLPGLFGHPDRARLF